MSESEDLRPDGWWKYIRSAWRAIPVILKKLQPLRIPEIMQEEMEAKFQGLPLCPLLPVAAEKKPEEFSVTKIVRGWSLEHVRSQDPKRVDPKTARNVYRMRHSHQTESCSSPGLGDGV